MLHSMDPTQAFVIVMIMLVIPPMIGGIVMKILKTDYKGWDSFGKTIVSLFLMFVFTISATITTFTIYYLEESLFLRGEITLGDKLFMISLLQFIGWLVSLRND